MANKDFREIQVSSSLLVVIFLGVLALGVFIFLLGVSVGKRQVAAAAPTQVVTQQIPEPVKEPPVKPAPSETTSDIMGTPAAGSTPAPAQDAAPAGNPAPKTGLKETAADKPSAPAAKPPAETKKAPVAAPSGSGLYYVQVAAYTEKAQAQAAADKYRKQGYTAVVSEPKPNDTKTWYRVRLGGYTSRDRAVSLLAKLNTAAGKKTDFRVVQD